MAPLDRWLPEFDVHELHDIHVAAPPETAFAAALGIPVAPDALVRALFRVRGLPSGGSLEGAMRAIGFLPRQVQILALAEGALLGVAGGILGVAAAPPALSAAHKLLTFLGFGFPLPMRPAIAVATIVAAAAIGSVASLFPAWQAGRLDVVSALRRQE